MATFIKLDSNNHILNITHGDEDWNNSEFTKITDYTGPLLIQGYYNSDDNTISPPIRLLSSSLGDTLENDPSPAGLATQNFPVSLSFTHDVNSSFDSDNLEVENVEISEFRADSDSLSFLASPITPAIDKNFFESLITFPAKNSNDPTASLFISNLDINYEGWHQISVVCDSASFTG